MAGTDSSNAMMGQHEMLTPRHDMEPVDEEAEDVGAMGGHQIRGDQ